MVTKADESANGGRKIRRRQSLQAYGSAARLDTHWHAAAARAAGGGVRHAGIEQVGALHTARTRGGTRVAANITCNIGNGAAPRSAMP